MKNMENGMEMGWKMHENGQLSAFPAALGEKIVSGWLCFSSLAM